MERKDEELADMKRKYDEAAYVLQSSQQEVRGGKVYCTVLHCDGRDASDAIIVFACKS